MATRSTWSTAQRTSSLAPTQWHGLPETACGTWGGLEIAIGFLLVLSSGVKAFVEIYIIIGDLSHAI